MKYLTVTVPCYNSEDYMQRCIDSLVEGGDDVEVIIIDDGSTDKTEEIADYYEKLYPNIVKAVHKENGGHGSGVNKGMELATGMYFKVVDSDDWLDKEAYLELLGKLKNFCDRNEKNDAMQMPDLVICNYVYDHLDEGKQRVMKYTNVFKKEELCDWNEIGRFQPSQYLIMHALFYRTEILRECGLKLPEHTFYVDNLFSYQPLPYVKNLYYMDLDLYHYYLGRDDQSVNERVLMKRIDQQIYVTNLVSRSVDLKSVQKKYPKLASYMKRNISIMMSISSIHLLLFRTREAYEKRKSLWTGIKEYDKSLYYYLKYKTLSGFTYLPGRVGGELTLGGYRLAKHIYQFQ